MGTWRRLQEWAEKDKARNRENMRKAWGDFTRDVGEIRGEAAELREQSARQAVTRHGIGGGTHGIHAVLTVCTCGAWLPVWAVHALLRRGKSVTTPPRA